jgi:hypothetical protein
MSPIHLQNLTAHKLADDFIQFTLPSSFFSHILANSRDELMTRTWPPKVNWPSYSCWLVAICFEGFRASLADRSKTDVISVRASPWTTDTKIVAIPTLSVCVGDNPSGSTHFVRQDRPCTLTKSPNKIQKQSGATFETNLTYELRK